MYCVCEASRSSLLIEFTNSLDWVELTMELRQKARNVRSIDQHVFDHALFVSRIGCSARVSRIQSVFCPVEMPRSSRTIFIPFATSLPSRSVMEEKLKEKVGRKGSVSRRVLHDSLLPSRFHIHFANFKNFVSHGGISAVVIKYPHVTPSLLFRVFCTLDRSVHLSHKFVPGPVTLLALSILHYS